MTCVLSPLASVVQERTAGWVWPGISIVSLTLQGVPQTLAHFAGRN